MEDKLTHIIHVKEYSDKITLSAELLSILDLPTEGVLWKKTESEYYLFSQREWHIFVQKMKSKIGMTPIEFEYTKRGREFIRGLHGRSSLVDLKGNQLCFPTMTRKKIMQKKDFTIHIYR